MLQTGNTASTDSRTSENVQSNGGERTAELFKYYRQFENSSFERTPVKLNRISARGLYLRHKKQFDDLYGFFVAHGLDLKRYIEFFVKERKRSEEDIDCWLFSRQSISDYMAKLQLADKKRKIYSWFSKSVSNIVDMCMKYDYMSGKDCLLDLMRQKRLAQEFMSGRISKYFFAAMPNFKNLIPKLDYFARLEFSELYDKFDIYNTEINDVFIQYRNRTVNPLDIVDIELAKRKSEKRGKNEDLFDPSL